MDAEFILDYGISEVLTEDNCVPTEEEIQSVLSRLWDTDDVDRCIRRLTLNFTGSGSWKVSLKSLILMNRVLDVPAANLCGPLLDRIRAVMNFTRKSSYFSETDGYDDPNIRVYYEWISTYASYFCKRLECFSTLKFDVVTSRFCCEDLETKAISRSNLGTAGDFFLYLQALEDLMSSALSCQTQGYSLENSMVRYILLAVAEEIVKIQHAIGDLTIFQTVKAAYDSLREEQDHPLEIAIAAQINAKMDDTESPVDEEDIDVRLIKISELGVIDKILGDFAMRLGNTDNWEVALGILIAMHSVLRQVVLPMNLFNYIRFHDILGFFIGKSHSQKYRSDGESVESYCEWISTYASYLQNRLEYFSSFSKYNKYKIEGAIALLDLCSRALCCYSQGAVIQNSLIQSQLFMVAGEITLIHTGIIDGLIAIAKQLPEFQPHDADKVLCNIKDLAKQQLYELTKLFKPGFEIHNLPVEVKHFLDINENIEVVPSKRRRILKDWDPDAHHFEAATVSQHVLIGNFGDPDEFLDIIDL